MTYWLITIALMLNVGIIVEPEEVEVIDLPDVFLKQAELVKETELVIEVKEEVIIEEVTVVSPPVEVPVENGRQVLFSNYYSSDGSSGDMTASGLSSRDFGVNGVGMYTYQGKVVLATANTTRMPSVMPNGFRSNELYDELVIEVWGVQYDAIVLDVCGMCTWGNDRESLQRVDIFTTHKIMGVENGRVWRK